MSINIPSSIVSISDPIDVVVRLDKLGANQFKSLMRGIETRVFTANGVVTELAIRIMDEEFGGVYSFLHIDKWRISFRNLLGDDNERIATAMEEVLAVGGLEDTSLVWSEQQRDRYSWQKNAKQKSGFENLSEAITTMRKRGVIEKYAHELMSPYMMSHFKKIVLDVRKNKSILTPVPEYAALADRIRRKELNSVVLRFR